MDFLVLHEFPSSDVEKSWRDFLARAEFPAHYDSPEYFLVPLWEGRSPFAVLALEGSCVRGVLTGIHDGNAVSCGVASRPQICVDPNADQPQVLQTLAKGLLNEASSAELVTVFSWKTLPLPAFADYGFRPRELQGSVVLNLTLGPDELFKQFPKDRRRNIRFAEKNGIEVSLATEQDLPNAFAVHNAWHHTERKVVKGDAVSYETFVRSSKLANRRMFVARVEGKIVAINIFRFCPKGLFESAANNSLDEYLHLKPNDLLQWRGIEWACSQGLRRHSLGGAHPFLRRFGGTVIPIVRYRLDRTALHRHDLRERVADMSRDALRRMPPSVGKRVRRLLGKDQ
jgi:Acetyltransferase (GNAT) domain